MVRRLKRNYFTCLQIEIIKTILFTYMKRFRSRYQSASHAYVPRLTYLQKTKTETIYFISIKQRFSLIFTVQTIK